MSLDSGWCCANLAQSRRVKERDEHAAQLLTWNCEAGDDLLHCHVGVDRVLRGATYRALRHLLNASTAEHLTALHAGKGIRFNFIADDASNIHFLEPD